MRKQKRIKSLLIYMSVAFAISFSLVTCDFPPFQEDKDDSDQMFALLAAFAATTSSAAAGSDSTAQSQAPTVTIGSVSRTTIATGGSNVTVQWTSNQSGTYAVKLNGTNCTDGNTPTGTNISGSCTASNQVSSLINNANFNMGANTVRICVTNSTNQLGNLTTSVTRTNPGTCGDGVIEGEEDCDDGNGAAGDGCSAICKVEAGFTCTGAPSNCLN